MSITISLTICVTPLRYDSLTVLFDNATLNLWGQLFKINDVVS